MKEQHNALQLMMLGLQHMLAMYAGAILVPLIVGAAIGLNAGQLTYLIAIDLFMCGAATLLQALEKPIFRHRPSRCARMYVYRSRPDDFHRQHLRCPSDIWCHYRRRTDCRLSRGLLREACPFFSACRNRISRHDHRHQPDSNGNE